MVEITVDSVIITLTCWYLYLIVGYGNTRKGLLQFALCKQVPGTLDPRFIRFMFFFIGSTFLFCCLGAMLPYAFIGILIFSPLIIVYEVLTYFVDKQNTIC